ncbi:MAG: hypothetical protein ABIQ17_02355 [Candidatus Limnocylindrales bacterium]
MTAPAVPSAPSAPDRGRIIARLIAAGTFAIAAIAGAYLDWIWWHPASGVVITLVAAAVLVLGGIVVLVGRAMHRVTVRRIALVLLAAGAGLLGGQNLGPDREPLIQTGGSMTFRLTSPTDAVATGPATCSTVASGTEFSITGDPNMRLDTPDQPFVFVYVNVGDRWQVSSDAPRKDGVLLHIGITGALITNASGKPGTIGMQATQSSTLESRFSNEGGSIRFANLVPQTGVDFNGESMDLAGTLEWTCGEAY